MSTILGISTAALAAIGLFIGLIGMFGKGAWGESVRGYLQAFPPYNAKLWAVIILIVSLIGGGIGATIGFGSSLVGKIDTSDLTGGDKSDSNVVSALNCEFTTPQEVTATDNVTVRADPNKLNHYYADVGAFSGAASINGTLFCKDNRQDISKGTKHDVYVKAGAFRNEVSTTDSNTYYILATSASASKVPGFSWQQTAYLADKGTTNAGAATTDTKERIDLVFAQDEASQYVGYYLTLPGATAWSYLNNQTSVDIDFVADGSTVATMTVTKTTTMA